MSFSIQHSDGQTVYVEVSPCCTMYPNYGLQYGLSLTPNAVNAETEFVHDKAVAAFDVPTAELVETTREHATRWLAANGVATLRTMSEAWAKAKADYEAASLKEQVRNEKRTARTRATYKAKGFTHVVNAWVHPKRGDDYPIEAYVKGVPDDSDIAGLLRLSTVKTDYRVEAL